jgi:hypothetical protein
MDALAALLTRKSVDHHVRRADQTSLHRACSLDREQFFHQGLVETAATLGEPFREHKMLLGALYLDLHDPPGIHPRQIGTSSATDLFV